MNTVSKQELINWLRREKNSDYLNKIQMIKDEAESQKKEFDQRVADGFTLDEFREEMHKRIKSWDWKK